MSGMRRRLALLAAGLLFATGLWGQDLGDAAARERAKREKKAAPGAPRGHVFTDADLKKEGERDAEGARSGSAPPTVRPSEEKGSGTDPEPGASRETPSQDETASEEGSVVQEWRERASEAGEPLREARRRVKELEQRIAELREKLNPLSTKYVLGGLGGQDPNQAFAVQAELTNAEAELVEARKALAEAQQLWDRFVAEARAGGAPAADLREPDP